MKILVLADGASSHTERYVRQLRALGCEVVAASLQPGNAIDVTLTCSALGELASYAFLAEELRELIVSEKPDIVNPHFATTYGFAAARCRRRFGALNTVWVLTVWGSDILISPNKSPFHRRRVRYALSQADMIFADSAFLKEQTERFTDSEVFVVPWGIERALISSDRFLKEQSHSWSGNVIRVIAPRPHEALYRNDLLLEALAPLLRSSRITLTVSGCGRAVESFRRRATELNVISGVIFYDRLTRAGFIDLFKKHLVYASASSSDSSPVSMIEALALGVAPLMADHPGLYDFLDESQKEQALFASESPETIGEKLEALISQSEVERLEMLTHNRKSALECGIYEDNISSTVGLFEKLIVRGGRQ